jgi:1-phosphatidylinositol-3-phosphate 5-kinase
MESTTNGIPRQRNVKIMDDVTSLTSFNPFSEEDEHDQSSYAIVTSLFEKVKNTLAAPLSSAVTSGSPATAVNPPPAKDVTSPVNASSRSHPERPHSLALVPSNPAPPLVSLTPVVSEAPSYNAEYDRPPSRGGLFYSPTESNEGLYGTAIPGFPIADDARSIRTTGSANLRRTASVSKVIRRIRGEGKGRPTLSVSS